MDEESNLPACIESVDIPQPLEVYDGDTQHDLARKHLAYLNGLLKGSHISLTQVKSVAGFGRVVDTSLKIMKAQQELLGLGTARRASRIIDATPVPSLPD